MAPDGFLGSGGAARSCNGGNSMVSEIVHDDRIKSRRLDNTLCVMANGRVILAAGVYTLEACREP